MKSVCIVCINFNSEKETHHCLVSLQNLKKDNIEVHIVIIDNGSKIPFQLTTTEKKNGVVLLRSETNIGFTGGTNMGISYGVARGVDFVLLINNDTTADSHILIELLKSFEEDSKVGLAVPKIYFTKGHEYHLKRYKKDELGRVFWYAGGYTDWANVFNIHRGVDEVDTGQYNKEEKITFATGCCMLIRTDVLEKVGLFDNTYYLYFEDADLSQRILQKGYNIVYVPKAILWHSNSASAGGSGSSLHDYYLTRNRMLFGMKYAPIRSKIALLRESISLFLSGRYWQKKAIWDFYRGNFGKGPEF